MIKGVLEKESWLGGRCHVASLDDSNEIAANDIMPGVYLEKGGTETLLSLDVERGLMVNPSIMRRAELQQMEKNARKDGVMSTNLITLDYTQREKVLVMDGVPIVPGLTLIVGGAVSGKTKLLEDWFLALSGTTSAPNPAYIVWGEPDIRSLPTDVVTLLKALDVADHYTYAKNEDDDKVVFIDSFKHFSHLSGAAMKGGLSLAMLDVFTTVSAMFARAGICIVATFNPAAAITEFNASVILAIKGAVTTIVLSEVTTGSQRLTYSTRAGDRVERVAVRPFGRTKIRKTALKQVSDTGAPKQDSVTELQRAYGRMFSSFDSDDVQDFKKEESI